MRGGGGPALPVPFLGSGGVSPPCRRPSAASHCRRGPSAGSPVPSLPLSRVRAPAVCPGPLSACRPSGGGSPFPPGLSAAGAAAAAHRPALSTLLLLLLPFLPVGSLEQGSPAVPQPCARGRPCASGDGAFLCALFSSWVQFLFAFSDFKQLHDENAKIGDGLFQMTAWREGTHVLFAWEL